MNDIYVCCPHDHEIGNDLEIMLSSNYMVCVKFNSIGYLGQNW